MRLAQRIPVEIALVDPPADAPLIVGATASVSLFPGGKYLRAEPPGKPPLINGSWYLFRRDAGIKGLRSFVGPASRRPAGDEDRKTSVSDS